MKKYLLAFGLNYHSGPVGSPLNGCINDVTYWQSYAKSKNFDSVVILTESQCEKDAMVAAMNHTLQQALPDDLVVVCYSGHGTVVPNGQSIVPYNFSFENPADWLTYNELDNIFMPHEIRNVKICCIFDSCMSAADPMSHWRAINPHPTKNRFLDQPQYIKDRIIADPFNRNVLTSPKGAVLLAGCQKEQTSADAYIDGEYHGAFTYSLSVALGANPSIDYFGAVLRSRAWLASNNYDQVPNVAGDVLFKTRIFFA